MSRSGDKEQAISVGRIEGGGYKLEVHFRIEVDLPSIRIKKLGRKKAEELPPYEGPPLPSGTHG